MEMSILSCATWLPNNGVCGISRRGRPRPLHRRSYPPARRNTAHSAMQQQRRRSKRRRADLRDKLGDLGLGVRADARDEVAAFAQLLAQLPQFLCAASSHRDTTHKSDEFKVEAASRIGGVRRETTKQRRQSIQGRGLESTQIQTNRTQQRSSQKTDSARLWWSPA